MECEIVSLKTNITYKNCKEFRLYFWVALVKYVLLASFTLGVCLLLSSAVESKDQLVVILAGIIFFCIIILFGLLNSIFGWSFEFEKSELIDWFKYNEDSYVQLQEHNHKELELMNKWRENHPFEEKIRQAMESKNSNDIANVVKMILDKETM